MEMSFSKVANTTHTLECHTSKGHYKVWRGHLSHNGLTEELEDITSNSKAYITLQHIALTSPFHPINGHESLRAFLNKTKINFLASYT